MLETSVLKPYMVANLHYQLSWQYLVILFILNSYGMNMKLTFLTNWYGFPVLEVLLAPLSALPFHSQDLISNSPYCLLYNFYDVSWVS